jgi:hypothetical protein
VQLGVRRQQPNQVVDLGDWKLDDEHPYLDGSKPKNAYYCPASGHPAFLEPKRRYLFKKSRIEKNLEQACDSRFKDQFWAEVVAYRIGCLAGIEVPPTFVAVREGQCGALIEWFHSDDFRMTPGTEEMVRLIPGFDRDRGSQHNLHTLEEICNRYESLMPVHWSIHWSKIFLFDALIANTDRHQENWGIIWDNVLDALPRGDKRENVQGVRARFVAWTPAFDNGTSMGFEFPEDMLDEKFIEIRRHTEKGCHHIREKRDSAKQIGHLALVQQWSNRFPDTRKIMRDCLTFSMVDLASELDELVQYEVPVPFTRRRADFVHNLIDYRRERLIEILEDEYYSACR